MATNSKGIKAFRTIMTRHQLLFCALTCLAAAVLPHCANAADPSVSDARMQVIMASRPAAGYFVLRNQGDTPVSLTGASAPDCGSLMMHRSSSQGGVSRMEAVEAVTVPAQGVIRFEPGGYHLMCMNPSGPLLSGKGTEPVTLHFAGNREVQAPFAISKVGQ